MYILGIETSCDETAASVIKTSSREGIKVLSNVISSQIEIHRQYGGVVPEVAAREHVLNILPVVHSALKNAKISPSQVTAIGITKGPGLVTSLITGLETVRALAFVWKKPLVEVNHIAGHIYANFIQSSRLMDFPAVILTVSGGHTILLKMLRTGKIEIIGETLDDAAGEAYDKAARMLGLGYPGGPIVSQLAQSYRKKANDPEIKLPRPMLNSADLNFSFSGLKTALLYKLQQDKDWPKRINQYCYEFQQAVIDILTHKTVRAAKQGRAKTIMLTGGVSANAELREQMRLAVQDQCPTARFFVPDREYTTDNAAMIATAAFYQYQRGRITDFSKLKVDASLQLK